MKRGHAFSAALFALAAISFNACTAPRAVDISAETTPKHHWRVGYDVAANVPTQTSKALYGSLEEGIDRLISQDSGAITAKDLDQITLALFAYSLDPLGFQPALYARFGLWDKLDMGYRYATGAHAIDLRYQFLGPLARDSIAPRNAWRGSVGLQGSTQSFDLPSFLGLDKLQSLLKYEFTRRDLLFPLALGKNFGHRGDIGGFTTGAVFGYSFIEYGTSLLKWVEQKEDGSTAPFRDLQGSSSFPFYGGFVNLRLGYKYVFVVGSFSAYWQHYGRYRLYGSTADLKGWTYIPSLGLEGRW